MNSTTNWINQDLSSIHQAELYRDAANQRLAHEAGERSRIIRVYESALASLGGCMVLWGTRLQKRTPQPTITQQMKAV